MPWATRFREPHEPTARRAWFDRRCRCERELGVQVKDEITREIMRPVTDQFLTSGASRCERSHSMLRPHPLF